MHGGGNIWTNVSAPAGPCSADGFEYSPRCRPASVVLVLLHPHYVEPLDVLVAVAERAGRVRRPPASVLGMLHWVTPRARREVACRSRQHLFHEQFPATAGSVLSGRVPDALPLSIAQRC